MNSWQKDYETLPRPDEVKGIMAARVWVKTFSEPIRSNRSVMRTVYHNEAAVLYDERQFLRTLPVFWLVRNGDSGTSGMSSAIPSSMPQARRILIRVQMLKSVTVPASILLIDAIETPLFRARSVCEMQQLRLSILIFWQSSRIMPSSEKS